MPSPVGAATICIANRSTYSPCPDTAVPQPLLTGGQLHGQRFEPSQYQPAAPVQRERRYGQPQSRNAPQQCVERDLPLQPGERCAQAIVNSEAKRQMLEQRQRPVADEVDCRLMSGNEKEEDHRQELVLTQLVARLFDLDQSAHEIILGLRPARFYELADVTQKHHDARNGSHHSPARWVGLNDGMGPAMELVAVLDGDTPYLRGIRRRCRVPAIAHPARSSPLGLA